MSRERIRVLDLLHFDENPKQVLARLKALLHKYLLYGGAMFGGKSYWLRWMLVYFLIRWAKRGFRNVEVGLFCEDYPTLKDRQLSKIGKEFPIWLGTLHSDHKLHGLCYVLAEEYGGGIIKFRNLDDPSKYQSAEFAAIAVDELTKNKKEVFDDLRNRLRWVGIPDVHFIAGTNPGGIGHSWVKKLWMDRIFDENEQEQDQFYYIPARLEDNPYREPGYERQLESLPPDKRKAYRDGDWNIFKGQYFTEWRNDIHTCQPFQIPDDWKHFCALDYGYTAPASLGWYATSPDGVLYRYKEVYVVNHTGTQLGDRYVETTNPNEKIQYIVADPSFWAKRGEDDNALSTAEKFENRVKELLKNAINKCPPLIKGNNDRLNGWREIHDWLKAFEKEGQLVGKFQVFSTCQEFIRTFPALIHDNNNPEDVDSDGEDHCGDEFRYAVMSRPRPTLDKETIATKEFDEMIKRKKLNQGQQKERLFIR
jgi:phage terminase large subunit